MLPIVLACAALALLASVVMLIRRSRAVVDAPVAPEPDGPRPRPTTVAAAVPAPARISGEVERPWLLRPAARSNSDALDTLDALLAELESTTVQIEDADALDEGSVATLEGLAGRLEAAAASLAIR